MEVVKWLKSELLNLGHSTAASPTILPPPHKMHQLRLAIFTALIAVLATITSGLKVVIAGGTGPLAKLAITSLLAGGNVER